MAGLTVAALALAGAVALVAEWPLVAQLLVVAGLLVSLTAARATLAVHAALPSTSAPRVLRVRVARRHPQASPSAMIPDGVWAGVLELARIARGGLEEPATSTPRRP